MSACEVDSAKPETDESHDIFREDLRFKSSLQELRDLRSQLHYAADFCESTFLNSQHKKIVLDDTKDYICRAVVTLVDHLGNVSANLDHCIATADDFSDADLRITCFQQRVQSCQKYVHEVALSKFRWMENFPRFHRRYLSAPAMDHVERCGQDLRRDEESSTSKRVEQKREVDAEDVPLFLYTATEKPSSTAMKNLPLRSALDKGCAVMAVRETLSPLASKSPNPTFHFQAELGPTKPARSQSLTKRHSASLLSSPDFRSLIRRARRSSTKY